jgi:single-strand DNA-binding protein
MQGIEAAFSGTVGTVPELKTSAAGKPWASFSAAVNSNDDGEDGPTWVRVACFGETAQKLCASNITKGDKLYVEGHLRLSHWTDKATGEQRHGLNVSAWKVSLMGRIGQKKLKTPRTRDQGEGAPSTMSA